MSGHVVVVGGGVIGVVSGWYLSQAGWQVTIVDRAGIGQGCSGGNCGLICPSHVLPLTEPGAIKQAFKAMLTPGGPFRIRPRLDPELWRWLWNFARRCNRRDMLQAAHAIQALLTSSMREYRQLIADNELDCEWQTKGLLFTYRHAAEWEAYEPTNELLASQFGEPAVRLTGAETADLEPAIREDIAGSWYFEHDAHLRPDRFLSELRSCMEAAGVSFREYVDFRGVDASGRKATAIDTGGDRVAADAFVFATGAWTPLLNAQLQCRIPIQPGKGYSITMSRPANCPQIPMIFPEHRVAVTPMRSGYRLGSIMEFAGYDERIRPDRLALLRQGAEHYLHEPHCEPELETWFGWRPMTYDSLPIIDRCPAWDNVWLATGHNMLGLSMAPATGRLISELLAGAAPHVKPHPYRLTRF